MSNVYMRQKKYVHLTLDVKVNGIRGYQNVVRIITFNFIFINPSVFSMKVQKRLMFPKFSTHIKLQTVNTQNLNY